MKTLIATLIAFLITISQLISQNPFTQNRILELNYFNYNVSDFGITNAKNLLEIDQNEYGINYETKELKMLYHNNFKVTKGKITNRIYKSKYHNSESKFIYDKKFKTLQKRVYNNAGDEEVSFKFDAKKRITQVITVLKNDGTTSSKFIDYNDANNSVEIYIKEKDDKKRILSVYLTNNNGLIVSKTEKASWLTNKEKHRYYTYNGNNISIISKNESVKGKTQTTGKAISNLKYNNKGLIIELNGNLGKSDYNLKQHNIYQYKYDQYGNWIEKYEFSTIHGYEDLNDKNYKGIRKVTLRKLTYKNGTNTGLTDAKASKINNYLNEIASNNPFKTKRPPKNGVYWFRNSERAIKVYDDGEYIGSQSNLLTILKNDFYVNDSINNKMYKLKDFMLKPIQKSFVKAESFASNNEVVWYRSSETAIRSFSNGEPLTYKLNYFKIFDNQFFINDSTTNNFYQLKDFKLKEISGAFHKAIKIGTQNEVLWIKLKSGNFTIIKNGKNITNNIKMVYAKNASNVLIKENGVSIYVMMNAKSIAINNFNKAITYKEYLKLEPNESIKEVIPNGFLWSKNEKEQFYIYKDGKIDPSKLNVVGFYQHQFIYDIDHDISYILKDFNTKKADKYYPIKVLSGNVFFYKTSKKKIGLFKNGKTINIKNSKYMDNDIDVSAQDSNGSDYFILKNYKNIKNLTLGQVIIPQN
jgi:hypothetical protein